MDGKTIDPDVIEKACTALKALEKASLHAHALYMELDFPHLRVAPKVQLSIAVREAEIALKTLKGLGL